MRPTLNSALIGAALCAAFGASAQDGARYAAPSGLAYGLLETRIEAQESYEGTRRTVRLRFVAPELADTKRYSFAKIEDDFQALCDAVGLKAVAQSAQDAQQIVISVSAAPINFGDSAPNIPQYFDLFLVEGNNCIWEGL